MAESAVTFSTKLSYGIGGLGKDFAYAITATFLMFYFTDVAGIAPAFIGTVFLVARIIDAFTDPLMGVIVDNTRSKYGKFRPWILIGTLINSVFILGVFYTHAIPAQWMYAYAAFTYVMWGVTYTIMDIPFWSMISSLSRSREEREKLVVWPRLFATVAGALIGTYGLMLAGKMGGGDMGTGFFYLSMLVVIAFTLSSIICFANVKPVVETSPTAEKLNLKDIGKTILANDQLRVLIAFVLIHGIGNQFIGGFNIYYTVHALGRQDLFALISFISAFGGPAGVFFFPHLCRMIPRRYMWFLVTGAPAAYSMILLLAYILGQENAVFISFAAAILSFGGGLTGSLIIVLLGDIIDYGEKKTGRRTESVIFSTYTMLTKSTSALSAFFIGIGLTLSGYVANTPISDFTAVAFRGMIIVPPVLLMLSSAYVYKRFYTLKDSGEEYSAQIAVA